MRKQITSLLLTLAMLLSLVPTLGVTASAADGFTEVSTYGQLKDAVEKGSAKVKLVANIDTTNENGGAGLTSTTNLTFKGGGHVLDLNGHTLKLVTTVKDTHLIAVEAAAVRLKWNLERILPMYSIQFILAVWVALPLMAVHSAVHLIL